MVAPDHTLTHIFDSDEEEKEYSNNDYDNSNSKPFKLSSSNEEQSPTNNPSRQQTSL